MAKPDLGALIAQTMAPPAESRSIETITSEILELKKQVGEALLGIGQRLIEAKEMLPHGEWLPWLTERVEFSARTAQYYMQLAREWTNPQSLADLGATKAFKLLAIPAEEREVFIQERNVVDMLVNFHVDSLHILKILLSPIPAGPWPAGSIGLCLIPGAGAGL